MPGVLVGTKTDVGARQIADGEVEAFAAENGLEYVTTSCKGSPDSCKAPFQVIAKKFADSYAQMLKAFHAAAS